MQRTLLAVLACMLCASPALAGEDDQDQKRFSIGLSFGLRPDMAVIAPAGVVGRIITPSARAAMVQLLIDRNAAAGALVERTRAQGVVEGTGRDLRMNYVPATADIQVGDVLVTSGIDGIYPKGFVIGQIESLERRAGEFSDIVIRPAVDFSSLEAVLVVLTPAVPAEDGGTKGLPPQDGE